MMQQRLADWKLLADSVLVDLSGMIRSLNRAYFTLAMSADHLPESDVLELRESRMALCAEVDSFLLERVYWLAARCDCVEELEPHIRSILAKTDGINHQAARNPFPSTDPEVSGHPLGVHVTTYEFNHGRHAYIQDHLAMIRILETTVRQRAENDAEV